MFFLLIGIFNAKERPGFLKGSKEGKLKIIFFLWDMLNGL